MKKLIVAGMLLLATLIPGFAWATHLYGADLFYTHTSGLTYQVTLVLYGDCSGSSFPTFVTASPEIKLFNGTSTVPTQTFSLIRQGAGVEVTPVCPGQVANSACNGGTLPGVTRYTYSRTMTLPSTSAQWLIRFTGNMGANQSAGRSNSITNLAGTSIMALEARLNNLNGANSSPQFTTIPTPFYCVNTAQEYNQGAVDANGDSLAFELTSGIAPVGNGNSVTNVTYVGGASPTNPVSTAIPINFNNLTGQMSFTANVGQKSLVVNKVSEYRNGVLVGTSMREMTFVVLDNCNNTPPAGNINNTTPNTGITGGAFDGNNVVNVCTGATVSFKIHPTDGDGDSLQVSLNGIPAGAVTSITGNNTVAPEISFSWNTAGVPAGYYTFYATYKDYACPLSSNQTQAYTVRIVRPYEGSAIMLSPTQCAHQALIKYNLGYGVTPRTVTIKVGNTTVKTLTSSLDIFTDSLPSGSYTMIISSPVLPCSTSIPVYVVDSGTYPVSPTVVSPMKFCQFVPASPLVATGANGGSLNWYDASFNLLPGTPTPSTSVAGLFTYYVSNKVGVCESLKDTLRVKVTTPPVSGFSISDTLCINDTVTALFNGTVGTGTVDYTWTWGGAEYSQGSGPGPWKVNWQTTGAKTITLRVTEDECESNLFTRIVHVKPSPKAAFSTSGNLCQCDSLFVRYTAVPLNGQLYTWDFDGGSPWISNDPGPLKVNWPTDGEKHIRLTLNKDGCLDVAEKDVMVYATPLANILNESKAICMGDQIDLTATGGLRYKWSSVGSPVQVSRDSIRFGQVMVPTVFTVQAYNEYGCFGSDSISYDRIESCCSFGYPSAFTPNNDGRNDRFHVVSYGNQDNFELSIFNRWGQRVYISFDPAEGWDGNLHGKPAEGGTYFYLLKAKCVTGKIEQKSGELMLVR